MVRNTKFWKTQFDGHDGEVACAVVNIPAALSWDYCHWFLMEIDKDIWKIGHIFNQICGCDQGWALQQGKAFSLGSWRTKNVATESDTNSTHAAL